MPVSSEIATPPTPIRLVVDTGAPTSMLDKVAADAAGIETDADRARSARGLDDGKIGIAPGRAKTVRIGDELVRDVDLFVGALPVFDTLRGRDERVGLLGNSLLSRSCRVEFDFANRVMRLVR